MKSLLSILFIASICSAAPPNIVLIMADDLGAESCNSYGGDLDITPNIDKIAEQGVRFLHFHASTQCTPSRGRLLTGRDSEKTNIKASVGPYQHLFTDTETTIGNVLKAAGYNNGTFGKWHVWLDSQTTETIEEHVAACGFDEHYINAGNLVSYGDPNDEENFESYKVNQAVLSFISATNQPFFVKYVPHLPHDPFTWTPLNPTGSGEVSQFAAMIKYLDVMVSNVIDKVTAEGIADNTAILFLSDNGTAASAPDSLYQGTLIPGGKSTDDTKGTKVPFHMRWDGNIATNTTYDGLTDIADISVTLAQIAGTSMPVDRLIDGRSFLEQIKGTSTRHHRAYIYFGNQTAYAQPAVWDTEYKLISNDPVEFYSTTNWPYGDAEISDNNQVQTINEMRLGILLNNYEQAAYGDTPFGGHTNERVFFNTP